MTDTDPEQWLIKWFADESDVPRDTIEQNREVDYLGKGWIDSMQFIRLVSKAEEEFGIEFSNDEFQDRSFATIRGLATLIEEKSEVDGR